MEFVSGFLLALSLCFDLGIVNVAIIKTGIERGFNPSLLIGLGSCLGDIVYAVVSFFGIALVLKFLVIRWILWVSGTAVLLYFCYSMIVQSLKPSSISSEETPVGSNKKFFLTGFSLALSSPTSILWFATVGGSVIASQKVNHVLDLVLFLGGFTFASLVWSIFLSYISFKGGQLLGNSIKRIFSIISAIIFLALAIYVFMNGYRSFVK